MPGKTHPTGRAKRSQTRTVQPIRGGGPKPCAAYEDVRDTPLVRRVPDRKLQRQCVPWVMAAFIAAAACISIAAIAVGSVPAQLATAALLLAAASLPIVRYAFKSHRRKR